MTIKTGEKLPEATLTVMGDKGPQATTTAELFDGKTVAVFAVPGAFTPTCSAKHLPGFLDHAEDFKAKGVDEIVCLSVNDAFVMNAWGKDQNVGGRIVMAADGSADFTKKLGLEMDASKFGMGTRSQRYSMLVKNGVVEKLNVEEPGAFSASSAETLLGQI